MTIIEVAVVCLSLVGCALICGVAYLTSEINKARISQEGIDRRAALKMGGENTTTSSYGQRQEWWVPILTELMKNPDIMKIVSNFAMEKLQKKE